MTQVYEVKVVSKHIAIYRVVAIDREEAHKKALDTKCEKTLVHHEVEGPEVDSSLRVY